MCTSTQRPTLQACNDITVMIARSPTVLLHPNSLTGPPQRPPAIQLAPMTVEVNGNRTACDARSPQGLEAAARRGDMKRIVNGVIAATMLTAAGITVHGSSHREAL